MNKKNLIIFLCLITVFTSGCVQSKQNAAYNSTETLAKEEIIANNSQVANQSNTIQPLSVSAVQKADYFGTWEDLYSQRANCTIKELKSHIKTEINWSSSAVENTKWIFECQYDSNTGDLMCKNGKQIESYPVKNGVRIYGAGDNPDDMEEKIVKQNLQTSIKIKKGNLKSALNEVDYMGDKDEALNFYKNMTLKINLQDLSKNIFVK